MTISYHRFSLCVIALTASAYTVPVEASDAELIAELRATLSAVERRLAELERAQEAAVEAPARENPATSMYEPAKVLQVYGQMRVSVDSRSGDFQNTGTTVSSNASRFGIRGAAATGVEGLELFYQAEMQYETAGPSSGPASKDVSFREGFAGFQSPWGKVRVGRLSTPYKTTLTTIDPWSDNALQSRAGGRGGSSEFHANFFNNTIEYSTASSAAGFSASMWHAAELENSGNGLYNTSTLQNFSAGSADGIGVRIVSGALFLSADRIEVNADAINLPGLSNGGGWQAAARYSFDDWSFAAFYEDVAEIGLGRNSYINGIYGFEQARIILAYGQNRDAIAYGDEDFDNWSIGVKYDLTEGSEVFAGYNRRTNRTSNLDFDTISVGVNAKFGY